MAYTTSEMIDSIRIRGSIPTSDSLFSTSNFLTLLTEEMLNTVVPVIQKINEDYNLVNYDISVLSGTSTYRLPTRVSAIRDIQLVSSSGSIQSLARLFEEDRTSTTSGQLGYYLKGNKVELSPSPTNSSDTLRIVYFRRPSKFVLTSACAQITNISGTTITVSALPTTMTTGTVVDFCQSNSPYDIITQDVTIVSASGTTLTFSSIDSDIIIGDYICLSSQTCVPGIQEELVPMLIQAALCVVLTSKKDTNTKIELEKLELMKQTLVDLLSPRVMSNDKIITSSNSIFNWMR